MLEGIQVLLHTLFIHTTGCDLILQHLIIMDTLSACSYLKSLEQKVKA